VAKERLRDFLLSSEAGRRAVEMEGRQNGFGGRRNGGGGEGDGEGIGLEELDSDGKRAVPVTAASGSTPTPRKSSAARGVWDDDE